ncbi:hypothetical protein J4461_02530 [Candidatus Pacearchaeota archaeon]|nr:hypothetical protein [Candidatus Pacearchaeota archaeon]
MKRGVLGKFTTGFFAFIFIVLIMGAFIVLSLSLAKLQGANKINEGSRPSGSSIFFEHINFEGREVTILYMILESSEQYISNKYTASADAMDAGAQSSGERRLDILLKGIEGWAKDDNKIRFAGKPSCLFIAHTLPLRASDYSDYSLLRNQVFSLFIRSENGEARRVPIGNIKEYEKKSERLSLSMNVKNSQKQEYPQGEIVVHGFEIYYGKCLEGENE